MNRNSQDLIAMVAILVLVGCSSHPQAPQFPELDPGIVATKAIQQFDADGNKLLDSTELTNCPSLAASMKRLDQDNDGQVSEQELKSRLSDWLNSGTALVGAIVQVTINGKPLVGPKLRWSPKNSWAKLGNPPAARPMIREWRPLQGTTRAYQDCTWVFIECEYRSEMPKEKNCFRRNTTQKVSLASRSLATKATWHYLSWRVASWD